MKNAKWKIGILAISYLFLAVSVVKAEHGPSPNWGHVGGGCVDIGDCVDQGASCTNGLCTAAPPTEDDLVSKGLKGITGLLGIFGQGAGVSEGPQEPEVIAGKIILGFLLVIGVVFGILVIYGGYLWMTARGNEEQAKKAIGILETAVIGFIIVVGAYAITSFVVERVITAAFPPPSP